MVFNDVGEQRSFETIPDGTLATVRMKVRPGNAGEGGWLRRSKDGNSEALDCEFVVLDGSFAKRKFWTLLTVTGTTEGHKEAADISKRYLRAMLESARGIRPDDKSDAAKEARRGCLEQATPRESPDIHESRAPRRRISAASTESLQGPTTRAPLRASALQTAA